ncbi:hypothetical protein BDV26DRAFT_297791 [Aspergillus bertholletiae]|uniref:NAD-dependent epimerase/dehydratase domain-containing protein n=1 Tax=Aspergillus bertholletiae TaxID=1226010 RepID=A0A5N7ARN1_9EURO|nr:hypothetical protein BDV26DRAFT_297791 [Aspergillus bertholletiae]
MVKVLVTGGNGFVAAHIIDCLLEHGFDVVATVRSEEKGRKVLHARRNLLRQDLSFAIVEDIAVQGAFDEVLQSQPPFRYVIHTASPAHYDVIDPMKDFLDPAVKGTRELLTAIKGHAPFVKRVVITSSFAAMVNPNQHPSVYDENVWNPMTWEEAQDSTHDYAQVYCASKKFAEKEAWDFLAAETPNFDITVINPPQVLGPIVPYLNSPDAVNTSNVRIKNLIQGKHTNERNVLWVDVRDVALAHVRAIQVDKAGGHRFFVTAGYFTNKELAQHIAQGRPELRSCLPPIDAFSALGDHVYQYNNTKSVDILGLRYRPLKETALDTVDSLLRLMDWA